MVPAGHSRQSRHVPFRAALQQATEIPVGDDVTAIAGMTGTLVERGIALLSIRRDWWLDALPGRLKLHSRAWGHKADVMHVRTHGSRTIKSNSTNGQPARDLPGAIWSSPCFFIGFLQSLSFSVLPIQQLLDPKNLDQKHLSQNRSSLFFEWTSFAIL